jgi:hypothetical protein
MRIRMLRPIAGVVESIYENVHAGDILDIDPVKAAGWISLKWAADVDQEAPVTAHLKGGPTAHY